MATRQYDIYIDGQKLPDSVLGHAQTQVGQRVNLNFNGSVRNLDTNRIFATTSTPFAALGGTTIAFVLLLDDDHNPSVRIFPGNAQLLWHLQDVNSIHALSPDAWWELDWGDTYVLFKDALGPGTHMTLRVQKYRIPLAPVDSKLNRVTERLLLRLRNI